MSSNTLRFGTATVAPRRARTQTKSNIALWAIQWVLALLFLFAGGMKLVSPIGVLAAQSHLSGEFMKFIGVCETLGALGLVLPGITGIRVALTPLAAFGLQIIMGGAVVVTLVQGPAASAIVPLIVGLLCGVVAHRRRHS